MLLFVSFSGTSNPNVDAWLLDRDSKSLFPTLSFATCTKTAFGVMYNATLVSRILKMAMVLDVGNEQEQRALAYRREVVG